ncbi:IclR family transcriptional regulator [Aurantiacibacter arachoides]|nr:helix-turn-helix domain-containing protein [Aurantiacibacter arachoides]GGD47903.1 transcriptional regulator [Aurantiacibacter arachoides]
MATTADRVLGLLSLFTEQRARWTVEEAAEVLTIPTSTAYRYFRSLAEAELLSSDMPGSYVLGPAVCALDRAMLVNDPFINAAAGEMSRLAADHPDTIVLLTRLYRDTVMCVHREGDRLAADGYERGRPMPLDRGAASKVILANLSPRQFRALARTKSAGEGIGAPRLQDALRGIRAQGYAITKGEIDPDKIGLSVPVLRDDNSVEGSLSFVLRKSSLCDEHQLLAELIRGRKAIEGNLLLARLRATHSDTSGADDPTE